jgi:hypothetical protein
MPFDTIYEKLIIKYLSLGFCGIEERHTSLVISCDKYYSINEERYRPAKIYPSKAPSVISEIITNDQTILRASGQPTLFFDKNGQPDHDKTLSSVRSFFQKAYNQGCFLYCVNFGSRCPRCNQLNDLSCLYMQANCYHGGVFNYFQKSGEDRAICFEEFDEIMQEVQIYHWDPRGYPLMEIAANLARDRGMLVSDKVISIAKTRSLRPYGRVNF